MPTPEITTSRATPLPCIRPRFDLVIVRPDREADTMRGSIHVPDQHQAIAANDQKTMVKMDDQFGYGTVLDVGPGARIENHQRREPMSVSVGDRVIYTRAEAMPTGLDGDTRIIVREVSIGGILVPQGEGSYSPAPT